MQIVVWTTRRAFGRFHFLGLYLVALIYATFGLSPLAQPTLSVGIDPGHGGHDPGALSHGLVEKEITLDIAQRVQSLLAAHDLTAFLTRTDDTALGTSQRQDLHARIQAVTGQGADVLVSIHVNSFHMPSVAGPRTYHHPGSVEGRKLAARIQTELQRAVGRGSTEPVPNDFYITRNSAMPAVLVEVGFLTNPEEASRLASPAYRERLAQAIATGIRRYAADSWE